MPTKVGTTNAIEKNTIFILPGKIRAFFTPDFLLTNARIDLR